MESQLVELHRGYISHLFSNVLQKYIEKCKDDTSVNLLKELVLPYIVGNGIICAHKYKDETKKCPQPVKDGEIFCKTHKPKGCIHKEENKKCGLPTAQLYCQTHLPLYEETINENNVLVPNKYGHLEHIPTRLIFDREQRVIGRKGNTKAQPILPLNEDAMEAIRINKFNVCDELMAEVTLYMRARRSLQNSPK
jgi:hypothetical protein